LKKSTDEQLTIACGSPCLGKAANKVATSCPISGMGGGGRGGGGEGASPPHPFSYPSSSLH
jgi:hypothetical protein